MNEKGFTLVEILAVIIIMGIVFSIVAFSISNVMDKATAKQYEMLASIVEAAAENYVKTIQPDELSEIGGTYCVTLQMLADENMINTPLVDPNTDENFDMNTCTYVQRTGDKSYYVKFNETSASVTLSLLGNTPDSISCASGGNYNDPGVNVNDPTNLLAGIIYASTPLSLKDAGTYSLSYSYTDSTSTTYTKSRTVIISNSNTPTITIAGNVTAMSIPQWAKFTAPTATASDACEGAITVTVTSNVVPTVPGTYTVTYTAKNKANITTTKTVTVTVTDNLDDSGANYPQLGDGMIPVYWDGSVWKKADVTNNNATYKWYDYAAKMWANAVTVTSANRATYLAAAPGTTITDINTMWVWIPRYKYAIPAGTGARTINVVFESSSTAKSNGTAIDTSYKTHPAFTFGSTEVEGIWMGKFDTAYLGATSAATAEVNLTTQNKVLIRPNEYSWRGLQLAYAYTVSKEITVSGNAYGLPTTGVDAHITRNPEWGAMAYLTYSTYGYNTEVWINCNSNYLTGCACAAVSSAGSTTCNLYTSTNGLKASTTGTVYGVYDTSGGAWDYVLANYNGYVGATSALTSCFIGTNGDLSVTGSIALPDTMYYNTYTGASLATACSGGICYGHAMSETSNWNGDYTDMFTSAEPLLLRGAGQSSGTNAGTFAIAITDGAAANNRGFRISLITK